MSSSAVHKAKILQAFLNDGRGLLTFKNCDYSFSETESVLTVNDPNQGEVPLPKAILGEVYISENDGYELRRIYP